MALRVGGQQHGGGEQQRGGFGGAVGVGDNLGGDCAVAAEWPPVPPPTEPPLSEVRQTAAHAAALSEWDELGKVDIFPSGRRHPASLFRLLKK